ncbi:hypothetical protein JW707_00770 [Candidatus Woesearchaeota archaeon]|nr:hypothetical protein [Candidatus Woesearchaeota archaeon]
MGWLFKKKEQKMEIPPPPPPEGGDKELKELKPAKLSDMPGHPKSELAEVIPSENEEMYSMPEFPEIPKEEKFARPVTRAETEGPRFVDVASFQTVMQKADEIRGSLKKAENVIMKLGELKSEEEKEFEKWRSQLEDTEKKLSYIDKVIFKGE